MSLNYMAINVYLQELTCGVTERQKKIINTFKLVCCKVLKERNLFTSLKKYYLLDNYSK